MLDDKTPAMESDWIDRLKLAVEMDGRSKRALSLAAGLGPNFLSQLFTSHKEPGVNKFLSILNVLGAEAALFVVMGLHFDDADEELVNSVLRLPPALRKKALNLVLSLQDD